MHDLGSRLSVLEDVSLVIMHLKVPQLWENPPVTIFLFYHRLRYIHRLFERLKCLRLTGTHLHRYTLDVHNALRIGTVMGAMPGGVSPAILYLSQFRRITTWRDLIELW